MVLTVGSIELEFTEDGNLYFNPDYPIETNAVYLTGEALTPELRQACVELQAKQLGLVKAFLQDNKVDIALVKSRVNEFGELL